MSNMSYCRFNNTRIDLEECLEVLKNEEEITSESERKNAKRMLVSFLEFCYDQDLIEEIPEEEKIDELINRCSEEDE